MPINRSSSVIHGFFFPRNPRSTYPAAAGRNRVERTFPPPRPTTPDAPRHRLSPTSPPHPARPAQPALGPRGPAASRRPTPLRPCGRAASLAGAATPPRSASPTIASIAARRHLLAPAPPHHAALSGRQPPPPPATTMRHRGCVATHAASLRTRTQGQEDRREAPCGGRSNTEAEREGTTSTAVVREARTSGTVAVAVRTRQQGMPGHPWPGQARNGPAKPRRHAAASRQWRRQHPVVLRLSPASWRTRRSRTPPPGRPGPDGARRA